MKEEEEEEEEGEEEAEEEEEEHDIGLLDSPLLRELENRISYYWSI